MLSGLSPLEFGRLQMSVGYNTHKKGRPLSPVEVGKLLQQARHAGASLDDCARALNLEGTSQLGRFLRILSLPPDLRHLVAWGRSRDSIGFTTAVELVRIPDADDERAVATAILEEGLNTAEVREVAQIRRRSGHAIDVCLKEVLGMRPTVERRYVFIGAIRDGTVRAALAERTQTERDAILLAALEALGLQGSSGRLGEQLFTLVGDEHFNSDLKRLGREAVEAKLGAHIRGNLGNVKREN